MVTPTRTGALSGGDGPRRPRGRLAAIAGIAGLVVAADQVTKTWALHHAAAGRHVIGPLWLVLTFNSGAAFGLGSGVTPVVEALAVLLVVGLALAGRRARFRVGWVGLAGLGLVLGGAVGNLADRVLRHNHGAVIDFIDAARIGHRDWWPVFNVADAAIVVGAALLVIGASRRGPAPKAPQSVPSRCAPGHLRSGG